MSAEYSDVRSRSQMWYHLSPYPHTYRQRFGCPHQVMCLEGSDWFYFCPKVSWSVKGRDLTIWVVKEVLPSIWIVSISSNWRDEGGPTSEFSELPWHVILFPNNKTTTIFQYPTESSDLWRYATKEWKRWDWTSRSTHLIMQFWAENLIARLPILFTCYILQSELRVQDSTLYIWLISTETPHIIMGHGIWYGILAMCNYELRVRNDEMALICWVAH